VDRSIGLVVLATKEAPFFSLWNLTEKSIVKLPKPDFNSCPPLDTEVCHHVGAVMTALTMCVI
jgi:hypothetical protein